MARKTPRQKALVSQRHVSLAADARGNRDERRDLEELVWRETTAGWMQQQAAIDDPDLLAPLAQRLPAVVFTDDELEDF